MARTPIHPGEILDEELKELDMSARKLAAKLGVPSNRLSQIICIRLSNAPCSCSAFSVALNL